jgi:2-polyprenyl-6-methoxyphenol hydroxylase-like FAD-dependent oxidoreductase
VTANKTDRPCRAGTSKGTTALARALIIGGSLGGLFAGLLLRQAGFDVTVFERSAGDLASRGAGIGTHAELFDVMRRLGVTVDEKVGVPISARICLDRDGKVLARLPFEKILSSWALVYRALRRQLPDACYRAGMQLEDIVQDDKFVRATFSDGSQADGDLLVGADGLHSTVRARAFDMPGPSYAGYVAWRGGVDEQAVPPAADELIEATTAPFFQPIFDLSSPRVVAGRVALLGDAASVARPHVGAGVSKAAMNAAWLADALAANTIEAGLAAYEQKTRAFGKALVERARFIGAYLEDPPRPGLKPEPIPMMLAIGQPLREIAELQGLF